MISHELYLKLLFNYQEYLNDNRSSHCLRYINTQINYYLGIVNTHLINNKIITEIENVLLEEYNLLSDNQNLLTYKQFTRINAIKKLL